MTWDPSKHPRHPAGSPQGGEFAGVGVGDTVVITGAGPGVKFGHVSGFVIDRKRQGTGPLGNPPFLGAIAPKVIVGVGPTKNAARQYNAPRMEIPRSSVYRVSDYVDTDVAPLMRDGSRGVLRMAPVVASAVAASDRRAAVSLKPGSIQARRRELGIVADKTNSHKKK